nr:transposase (putative), gypsy type [Tanacetum cinerariifolium]
MVLFKSSITTQRSRKAYQSPLPWGVVHPPAQNTHIRKRSVTPRQFTTSELKQSLLLGRREGIPDRRGLADECPKDGMPAAGTYSLKVVRVLDTHRTPIQKQPEMLLCLVEISRRYYLGDEMYLTFLHDDDRDMDLFNLIRAPNPTKVKIGSRPRAHHEVPLLTLTAPRVIEMDEPAATDSSGVPSTIERSPLDFAHEAGASDQGVAAPEMPSSEDVPATAASGAGQAEETATMDPHAALESRKKGHDGTDVNAPPKSLRRDHVDPRSSGSSHGGKSLAAIQLGLASTVVVLEDAPMGVSDPDPLSFADAPSRHPVDVAQSSSGIAAAGDPKSENAFSPAEVRSPGSIYQPEWGVTNGSLLDTPEACQDLVDHARELEIRNLKASLEAEANAKRVAEDKSAGLSQELKRMRAQFSDLQVNNERLSQQVATLQQQVFGEEKLKAAFEEFKRQQDERVEQRCAEMDARLDALSIDFDEELYPHMLIAIAGSWQAFADAVSAGIAKGLSEGLRHGLEHGQAHRSLESIEAYDLKAEAKFVAALQALKDLKYPLVDQLEGLRDAPMDVIMAALYLESDTGDDASQDVRDLRPSSSQLTIPVYPEVRDPRNPWACKEEIGLADAIAANISRAEKKRRSRIVCRTHGVGSAHHARSDGVPVSTPTVVP